MKFVLFVTLIWSILDSGWSITDEDLVRIEAGLSQIQVLTREMAEVKMENNQIRMENKQMRRENREMKSENIQLHLRVSRLEETCGANSDIDLVQNATIEERVTFLEVQMTEVQADVLEIKDEAEELQDQVAFLFDEQVIQDERIYDLEQETTALDTRVEVLEANGGGGGNVTALEERVETLEGTASEHEADIADLDSTTSNLDGRVETLEGVTSELETRLTAAETLIEGLGNVTSNLDSKVETLEGETSELETRLTAAETMIEDLQATDVELDSRISDLEEGGGGASNETTIAFRAVMHDSDVISIPIGSTMIFSDVQLNEGNGYDPSTGIFTVPSGGEGYYYFATHFTVHAYVYANIDLRVNDVTVCTMHGNNQEVSNGSNGVCNAVVFLSEGYEVKNVYWAGTDSTPVFDEGGIYNGFSGFKI